MPSTSKENFLDFYQVLSRGHISQVVSGTGSGDKEAGLRTLAAEKGSLYWSLILRSDWLMGGKGWPVSANQRPRKKSSANPSPRSVPAKEQAVAFNALLTDDS